MKNRRLIRDREKKVRINRFLMKKQEEKFAILSISIYLLFMIGSLIYILFFR